MPLTMSYLYHLFIPSIIHRSHSTHKIREHLKMKYFSVAPWGWFCWIIEWHGWHLYYKCPCLSTIPSDIHTRFHYFWSIIQISIGLNLFSISSNCYVSLVILTSGTDGKSEWLLNRQNFNIIRKNSNPMLTNAHQCCIIKSKQIYPSLIGYYFRWTILKTKFNEMVKKKKKKKKN